MNKKSALEFSLLIDEMCVENNVQVAPRDRLWDVTVKMVKKQDKETLKTLYRKFHKRSSQIAIHLTAAIEEEWELRTFE